MEERIGFARLAIEQGYPIVPFAAIGADDMLDVSSSSIPATTGDSTATLQTDEEHERDALIDATAQARATAPATAGIVRSDVETSTSG